MNGHDIIEVNLSRTDAIDCAGLGALLAIRNLARSRHGGVRLVGAGPAVERMLQVARARDLFDMVAVGAQEEPAFSSGSALSAWDTSEQVRLPVEANRA